MVPGVTVIALGGNAIARKGDDGSIEAQYRRAEEAMTCVARVVKTGAAVVITHGNGPVVGNIVLRSELASKEVPMMPLYISDADSQGGVGLMLQQTLHNALVREGTDRSVCSLVTQVVVDPDDPGFAYPTKPIGGSYQPQKAQRIQHERGWAMSEQPDGLFRRVVASPHPLRIVEMDAIRALLAAGTVAITAGGGGVPVLEKPNGELGGVDAVIDKDWTSSLLARDLPATRLVIAMEAEGVFEDWGTPQARLLRSLTVEQAKKMLATSRLGAGSIAPKLQAAVEFAENTWCSAILCSTSEIDSAVSGRAGTVVTAV